MREEDVHGGFALGSMRSCGDRRRTRAVSGGLTMVHDRVRRDEYPRSGPLGPPAEVEIIAEELELGVESPEEVPYLPPDEHAGGAHREDIANSVVLALIVLTAFEPGEPAT
jgi:hypothetical protein